MNRKEVYRVVDEERDFQDSYVKVKGYKGNTQPESVTAEMVIMKTYLDKAFTEWTHNKGDAKSLIELRKVVTIGVRCFENHGVPSRD